MTSILQQEYNRGYRDGLGQISQMEWGEAYEEGRLDAIALAPSRFRWFATGILTGIMIWELLI